MSNVYLINHHYCKLVHDRISGCNECVCMGKCGYTDPSNISCISAAIIENKDDSYTNYHFEKCKISKGDKLITAKNNEQSSRISGIM